MSGLINEKYGTLALPYASRLANLGFPEAMRSDEAFKKGLNVFDGKVMAFPKSPCFCPVYSLEGSFWKR